MPLTDYPDLGFGVPEADKKPELHLVDTSSLDNFGKAPVFSMSPSVVHFGGFKLGADLRHFVSIVNCSPNSLRMLIMPPESDFYKVLFDSNAVCMDCNNFSVCASGGILQVRHAGPRHVSAASGQLPPHGVQILLRLHPHQKPGPELFGSAPRIPFAE